MIRKILVLFLLILSVCTYGSVYSTKTASVPQSYDDMASEPFMLNNCDRSKTYYKVMHTNNEVIIGVRTEDNINSLDRKIYREENHGYDKTRVEIFLCENENKSNFLEFIIYGGGIIYDACSKNSIFNNKNKVYPKFSKDYWDFVLVVDKRTLSPYVKAYDDWKIRINKLSNKDTEYIGENQDEWVDLYWTNDQECFNAFENKKNAKLREINKNIEFLPSDIQEKEKKYIEEVNQLSRAKTRESVNKIKEIFNIIDKLNAYCLGADQQKEVLKLKAPLPFMFSFVECGVKYNTKNTITYKNKTSMDIDLQVGEEYIFGLMISPYKDIDNLELYYKGDNCLYMGCASEIENIIDIYDCKNKDKINLTGLKAGESRLVLFKFMPESVGEFKGNIIITNTSIKLPVSMNVSDFKLPCEDRVVASVKGLFNYNDTEETSLNKLSNVCAFFVKNNIYSISLDFTDSDKWFGFKQNEFGKYIINTRNFDLAVKTIFMSGIKNIYIEPIKNMEDQYKVRAFANELAVYNNLSHIYMMISENNKESKIYQDYLGILKGKVNIAFEKNMLKNNYSIYDNNIAIRQDLCKLFINEDKEKLIVDCSVSKDSILYNMLGDPIVSSLRFKELKDALIDVSYLSLLKNKIKENKKNNKSYNEGELILKQFTDLQLVKAPELLTDTEFYSMRNKTIQFLKK